MAGRRGWGKGVRGRNGKGGNAAEKRGIEMVRDIQSQQSIQMQKGGKE